MADSVGFLGTFEVLDWADFFIFASSFLISSAAILFKILRVLGETSREAFWAAASARFAASGWAKARVSFEIIDSQ